MEPDTQIAIFAVVVSIFGLALTGFIAWRQWQLTKKLAAVGVAQWRGDLRDWASEAIDLLSEASYACDAMPNDASPMEYFHRYLHRNWALIDRGRFFLPNKQQEYRSDRVEGYKGFRHEALDALWAAGIVMEGRFDAKKFSQLDAKKFDTFKKDVVRCRRYVLEELQREFVSIMLKILDPWRYNKEIAEIIEARALISSEIPSGAEALLSEVVPQVKKKRDC